MAYTRQNFEAGQKIMAEKFNAMDDQIILNESNISKLSEEIADLPNNTELVENVAKKVPYVKVAESPVFVDSPSEMTDTSKMYVLKSDGEFYAYKTRTVITEGSTVPNFTNLYNKTNGVYIQDGYRYSNSGGAFKEETTCCSIVFPVAGLLTNGVPITLRVRGATLNSAKYKDTIYWGTTEASFTWGGNESGRWTINANGEAVCTVTPNNASTANYMVICVDAGSVDESDLIITIDEEITYTVTEGGTETITEWVSTGIKYNQPADYENRVIEAENEILRLQNENTKLSNRVTVLETVGVVDNSTLTMYISPTGNDDNDGLTSSAPKKSVMACVNAGANRVSAKRGVYREEINLTNVDTFEIFPTDNTGTLEPIVFDMSDTISVSALTDYNSIKSVDYSGNDAFTHAFTNGNLDIVPGTRNAYYASVWLITHDTKNNVKLTPKATIAEVEANENTFVWAGNKIYMNADFTNIVEIRVPTTINCGCKITTANKVKMTDVEFNFAGHYNLWVLNCADVQLDNCAVRHSSYGSGVDFDNVEGTIRNCYATGVRDGFAVSGYGHTNFIDCVAEYCWDDGISHHIGCTGTVIGGRYEGNAKAGNCPSYGAKVNIYGGLYKDNEMWGVCYATDSEHNECEGIMQGVVMTGNPIGLRVTDRSTVTAMICVYTGNTQDKEVIGTLTEY